MPLARQSIVLSAVTLLVTGIVMVTSAGLSIDPEHRISITRIIFSRTTLYAILAIAAMLIAARIDLVQFLDTRSPHTTPDVPRGMLSILREPATWILLITIVLLALVHVPGVGSVRNGAARWIDLQRFHIPLTFQPSEVAKWGMVLIMAVYATRMGQSRLRRFRTGFMPALVLLLAVVGLIITEDLGTAVLIVGVGILLLIAAGVRIWHVAILAPIPAALMVLAIIVSPYRIERIRAFLDPYADPQGQGYHMIQSMVAVSAGGITGRGLGHGVHKFGYLPEDTNDFLFAIICEELGLFGAVFVLFLYGVLIYSMFAILCRLTEPMARLITLGIMMTVGFQALINLLVVTGLAPTKGIALPLLSAGGTGWVLTAFSLGLVIGMDRHHGEECSTEVSLHASNVPATCEGRGNRVMSISPTHTQLGSSS